MTWKKLKSSILLQHPRLTVAEDDIELPDGHRTKYIYFAHAKDSVTAIAVRENTILIQQEYSYPPGITMHEFPGGAMEKDEQPEAAALRELKEEAGYTGRTKYLGSYYSNNRRSSSKMHVVLVENAVECKKEGGDTEEFITSQWVTINELHAMIAGGKIINFSILAGLALYDARIQRE
jgi:ADP-ribose pyrophosphatase